DERKDHEQCDASAIAIQSGFAKRVLRVRESPADEPHRMEWVIRVSDQEIEHNSGEQIPRIRRQTYERHFAAHPIARARTTSLIGSSSVSCARNSSHRCGCAARLAAIVAPCCRNASPAALAGSVSKRVRSSTAANA